MATKQSLRVYHDGYSVCDDEGHITSTLVEGSTPEEARAYACLFAAAPDLLAAALAQEELASLRMPGDMSQNIAKVREMRRAAIARATQPAA